ncbi:MAG: octanoyltransferase, partial [Myxococcota bacterium]|nr:octanoyltransferase [Myxococcota bacterium]
MRPLVLQDLGGMPYEDALAVQYATVEAVHKGVSEDTLLLVEHPAVFTLGRRRTAAGNVLMPGDTPVVQVERGGDVTWHGPGQLVAYPILSLQEEERDVHGVLRALERAVVEVLALHGL